MWYSTWYVDDMMYVWYDTMHDMNDIRQKCVDIMPNPNLCKKTMIKIIWYEEKMEGVVLHDNE